MWSNYGEANLLMLGKIINFQLASDVREYSYTSSNFFKLIDYDDDDKGAKLVCSGKDKGTVTCFSDFLVEILGMMQVTSEQVVAQAEWKNLLDHFLGRFDYLSATLGKQFFSLPLVSQIPKSDDSVLYADNLVQIMEAPDAKESALFEEYTMFDSEGGAVWFSGRLVVNHIRDEYLSSIYKYLLFMNLLEAPFRKWSFINFAFTYGSLL